MAEEQKKPVDMLMKRPVDGAEVEIAASLVEDYKARGFAVISTVEEARKKAAKPAKPAAEK